VSFFACVHGLYAVIAKVFVILRMFFFTRLCWSHPSCFSYCRSCLSQRSRTPFRSCCKSWNFGIAIMRYAVEQLWAGVHNLKSSIRVYGDHA